VQIPLLLTPTNLLMTNDVYIAGRLDDGGLVFDVSLNKALVELLTKAVSELRRLGSGVRWMWLSWISIDFEYSK